MLVFIVFLSVSIFTSVESQTDLEEDYAEYGMMKNGTCISFYCLIRNSTSCEEFIEGTEFDLSRVLDIDWKIFYFWNILQGDSHQIRFSVPSKLLVERYQSLLEDEIPEVNWADAELFMETSHDACGLLMKTNVSGFYRLISIDMYNALLNVPPIMVALKLVDRYLGLHYCSKRICLALAPADQMPEDDQITSAAAKMRFRSQIGRSYLTPALNETAQKMDPFTDSGDDDDDEWYLRNQLDSDD